AAGLMPRLLLRIEPSVQVLAHALLRWLNGGGGGACLQCSEKDGDDHGSTVTGRRLLFPAPPTPAARCRALPGALRQRARRAACPRAARGLRRGRKRTLRPPGSGA